ncbi:MAG: hypothetical protein WCG14_05745, partial [Chlamydiia bacterium]
IKKKPLVVTTKHQDAKKLLAAPVAKPLPSQPKKQKTESNKAIIPAKEAPIAKGDLPKKAQLQPAKAGAPKKTVPKETKPSALSSTLLSGLAWGFYLILRLTAIDFN